jgi:hypothetical protein
MEYGLVASFWFGDREMSKVGTKFVDGGFDFLELGRGRGFGIVDQGLGIGIRLNICRAWGL